MFKKKEEKKSGIKDRSVFEKKLKEGLDNMVGEKSSSIPPQERMADLLKQAGVSDDQIKLAFDPNGPIKMMESIVTDKGHTVKAFVRSYKSGAFSSEEMDKTLSFLLADLVCDAFKAGEAYNKSNGGK